MLKNTETSKNFSVDNNQKHSANDNSDLKTLFKNIDFDYQEQTVVSNNNCEVNCCGDENHNINNTNKKTNDNNVHDEKNNNKKVEDFGLSKNHYGNFLEKDNKYNNTNNTNNTKNSNNTNNYCQYDICFNNDHNKSKKYMYQYNNLDSDDSSDDENDKKNSNKKNSNNVNGDKQESSIDIAFDDYNETINKKKKNMKNKSNKKCDLNSNSNATEYNSNKNYKKLYFDESTELGRFLLSNFSSYRNHDLLEIIRCQSGSRKLQNLIDSVSYSIIRELYKMLQPILRSLFQEVYSNYLCQKIFFLLKETERKALLEELIQYLPTYKENNIYVNALKSIFSGLSSKADQINARDAIFKNLDNILLSNSTSIIVETMITNFDKLNIKDLEQHVISKAKILIKNSPGMYLLNKIIATNSPDEDKKASMIQYYSTTDYNNIISYNYRTLKYFVEIVLKSFSGFICLRNGSLVVLNLIESLKNDNRYCKLLHYLIHNINEREVIECSIKKYSNKVIEALLNATNSVLTNTNTNNNINENEFVNVYYSIIELSLDERSKTSKLNDSYLFKLCSKFRGINILQIVFERLDFEKRKQLYNNIMLILSMEDHCIKPRYVSILEDTLSIVKNNIKLNNNSELIIVKARILQQERTARNKINKNSDDAYTNCLEEDCNENCNKSDNSEDEDNFNYENTNKKIVKINKHNNNYNYRNNNIDNDKHDERLLKAKKNVKNNYYNNDINDIIDIKDININKESKTKYKTCNKSNNICNDINKQSYLSNSNLQSLRNLNTNINFGINNNENSKNSLNSLNSISNSNMMNNTTKASTFINFYNTGSNNTAPLINNFNTNNNSNSNNMINLLNNNRLYNNNINNINNKNDFNYNSNINTGTFINPTICYNPYNSYSIKSINSQNTNSNLNMFRENPYMTYNTSNHSNLNNINNIHNMNTQSYYQSPFISNSSLHNYNHLTTNPNQNIKINTKSSSNSVSQNMNINKMHTNTMFNMNKLNSYSNVLDINKNSNINVNTNNINNYHTNAYQISNINNPNYSNMISTNTNSNYIQYSDSLLPNHNNISNMSNMSININSKRNSKDSVSKTNTNYKQ